MPNLARMMLLLFMVAVAVDSAELPHGELLPDCLEGECQEGVEEHAMRVELLQTGLVMAHSKLHAAKDIKEVQSKAAYDADKSDWGVASRCAGPNDCKRNDKCQKLTNNGMSPITGTVDCKDCLGGRKCQVFGVGTFATCGCTARASLAQSEEAKLAAPREAEDADKSDWGVASRCAGPNDCKRNDKCQKLANNGMSPITGTVDCKDCLGGRKCQVFGVGTFATCGCTARASLAQAEEAKLAPPKEVEDADKSDWGVASRCAGPNDCKRNDKCQKLGNNGMSPITGTVDCKHCLGGRKCQVFGVGTFATCGCTVR